MTKSRLLASTVALTIIFNALLFDRSANASEVDGYNIPTEVKNCLKSHPGLSINGDFNPFYISADFDGDGKLDFAVQVRHNQSKDILVCLSTLTRSYLLKSSVSWGWPPTEVWRFDAWSVVPKHSKSVSWPSGARGDALLLDVKETANGLVYWDGKVFRWEQLDD